MPDWAAIFDWDGVVIDSTEGHRASWDKLAADEGRILPSGHFEAGFGMKNEAIIPGILRWSQDEAEVRRLADKKEDIYRALICERGIQPIPGVVEWLLQLQMAGIPRVIGSSTVLLNITTVLEICDIGGHFDDIVSADDVAEGKPDPAVFLMAAKKAGQDPSRCVVFEDAPVGIEAARAAGMKVVAVTTTRSATALTDADLVVDRLDELTPRIIRELIGLNDVCVEEIVS